MIRVMNIDNYKDVIELWKRTDGIGLSESDERSNIEMFLNRNEGLSYVYVEDNTIVGAVLCGHDGRRGYIHHLAVDSKYRGKKIGSILTTACLDGLKDIGIFKCHLFVFNNNELGKVFWERTGWSLREDLLMYSKNMIRS